MNVRNMSNPIVSVVIPTFNNASYISKAIDSVLDQTYTDFELLIIDNASTDNTEEIAKKYKDDRIKYIKNKKNIGMVNNWNKGLKLTCGSYFILLCSDDWWEETILEDEVKIFENNPDIVWVTTNGYYTNSKGEITKSIEHSLRGIIESSISIPYQVINFGNIILSSVMIRADIFKELGGYNKDSVLSCDVDAFTTLSDIRDVYFLNKKLVYYRMHESNTQNKQKLTYDYVKDFRYNLKKYTKLLKKYKINDEIFILRSKRALWQSVFYYKFSYNKIEIMEKNSEYLLNLFNSNNADKLLLSIVFKTKYKLILKFLEKIILHIIKIKEKNEITNINNNLLIREIYE